MPPSTPAAPGLRRLVGLTQTLRAGGGTGPVLEDRQWLARVASAAAHLRGLASDPVLDPAGAQARMATSGTDLAASLPEAVQVALAPRQTQALRALGAAVAADPGLLGDLWAAVADGAANKARGRFFTPSAVVAALLPETFEAGGKVLDPACGGGRFLLAALPRHPDGPAGLWGIDRDPLAVAICRVALWLAADGRTGARVEAGDPLAGLLAMRGGPRADDALEIPAGAAAAVVGNPPFRSDRRGAGLPHPEAWRAAFVAADYQLDPYALFVELGLHALKPAGTLCFVVPDAALFNLRARGLRRLLLAENGLSAVLALPAGTFAAGVDVLGLTVQRGGTTPASIPLRSLKGDPIGQLWSPPEDPLGPLSRVQSSAQAALRQAAAGWTVQLGHVAEITRGVNPYHHTRHSPAEIAARIHHANHQAGPDFVPELRGRHLPDAYARMPDDTCWLRYGPHLKEPRKPRFFEGPRLLVRKVHGQTLCAVHLSTPLICDQSIYVVKPRADSVWPMGALLACVNSRVVAALLGVGAGAAVFPQLKVAELRGVPLPPVAPDDPRVVAVAALAEALQETWTAGLASGALSPRVPTPALARARETLETAVAALYGVALPPAAPTSAAPTSAAKT